MTDRPIYFPTPDPSEAVPFTVTDSGERELFDSGMVRDTETGKVDLTYVIHGPMLVRWAEHMMKGAVKYDRENWMQAAGTAELERFKRSAFRHLVQWLLGETDEDHAAAILFNVNGFEYVKERMARDEDGTEWVDVKPPGY